MITWNSGIVDENERMREKFKWLSKMKAVAHRKKMKMLNELEKLVVSAVSGSIDRWLVVGKKARQLR